MRPGIRRACLLMGVGLLAAGNGCAETPLPAPPAGAAAVPVGLAGDPLLRVIPATTTTLLLADVAQLRTSPWTKEAVAAATASSRAAHIEERGFDEVNDVDRMAMAGVPAVSGAEDAGASLTVLQGRFDVLRVTRAAQVKWPRAEVAAFRGATIVSNGSEATGFIDDRIVLSGPLTLVRAALDCSVGKGAAIERSAWLAAVRGHFDHGVHAGRLPDPAIEIAVQVTPAMREKLAAELGEGAALGLFGARVYVRTALDVVMLGVARGKQEATDMAARLLARVRELKARPSVSALGLDTLIGNVRFATGDEVVQGILSVSEGQRQEVGEKMKAFAQMAAQLRQAGANTSAAGAATAP